MSTAFQSDAFQSTAFQILAGTGETPVEVPDVLGLLQAAGVSAIEAAGLLATVETRPSNEPAGTIIEQIPVGGTLVLPGSTVGLYVSSGSSGAGRPRRIRERYIARFKGEDHEFSTLEELEEFVAQAQKVEQKKPKKARKPIRIELSPDYFEDVPKAVKPPPPLPQMRPSRALEQIRQLERRIEQAIQDDEDDNEVLLWLM